MLKKGELFKFKVRQSAVYFSKQVEKKLNKEKALMTELDFLLKKVDFTEDEKVRLETIKTQIDQIYIYIAKGAFSRAKWLEKGEKNTSLFVCFSLEKTKL